jgi:hypothetical protein
MVLQQSLIDLIRSRLVLDGPRPKMEMVYRYLIGPIPNAMRAVTPADALNNAVRTCPSADRRKPAHVIEPATRAVHLHH